MPKKGVYIMKKKILSTMLAALLLGIYPAGAEAPQSSFDANHTFAARESYRMFHITDVGGGQDLSFSMNLDKEATVTLNVKTDDNPNFYNKTETGNRLEMTVPATGSEKSYYFFVRNETDGPVHVMARVTIPFYMPYEEEAPILWQSMDGTVASIDWTGEIIGNPPVITLGAPGGEEVAFAVPGGLHGAVDVGAMVHIHYRTENDENIADSVTVLATAESVDSSADSADNPDLAPAPQWVEGIATIETSTLLQVGSLSLLVPDGLLGNIQSGAYVHVDYHVEPGWGNIVDWIVVLDNPAEDPMPGPIEDPDDPMPEPITDDNNEDEPSN